MKRLIAIFLFLSFSFSVFSAEMQIIPEEYQKEEFPGWIHDLRRGEIIFFGSLPFTFFLASEVYGTYRYFERDMDPSYTPWPLGSPGYEPDDQVVMIISGVLFSLGIALGDFIIGKINGRDLTEREDL